MIDAQCPLLELAVWYPNTYSPLLISVTPISVKIAYVLREIALPQKSPKNTLVSVNC